MVSSPYNYENDYIKEKGKWKLKTIRCREIYTIHSPRDGFVKPERFADADDPRDNIKNMGAAGKSVNFNELTYPSGYILPFHFKHPVTGRETSERTRNSYLNEVMSEINYEQ